MSARIPISAAVLLVAGVSGALVPLVGPTFGYRMGNGKAWTVTESIATLHIAPGIVAVLGALAMLGRGSSTARVGASLALLAGAWFVVGPSLRPLWAGGSASMTMGHSSRWAQAASSLGYHYGTGVVIAVVAAHALGMLRNAQYRASSARSAAPAQRPMVATTAQPQGGHAGREPDSREPANIV